MSTAVLQQKMTASVGALSAERRRLEDEVMKLEQKAMTTDTDDLIRRLKADIDAADADQAKKRELLARAEAQRQTLARDKAAAQEAAHQQAVAACKARLAALLNRKGQLIEAAERLSRELLDTRLEIVSANAEARAEAKRLGYAAVGPTDAEVVQRMSLRESKLLATMPGGRHRFGHIVLPSGSFGLLPSGLSWSEDEERFHGDLRALVEMEG
jgi:hypothetical protein